MQKFFRTMLKKNNKGFTLVELMAVVLIIGILVAVAVPIYQNSSDDAKVKACESNVRILDGAIQQYLSANPDKTAADVTLTVLDAYVKVQPECEVTGGGAYVVDTTTGTITSHGHP